MAFENLPDESRIWIYGFVHSLNDEQYSIVKDRLERFKSEWLYHGASVTGDYDIIENQFVIIATNEAISGCSIDSSVAVFKELKQNTGLNALNQNLVYYREHEDVKSVNRDEFQQLVNKGIITGDTIVFNLMLNHLGSYKSGNFQIKFKYSWHSKAFKLPVEIES